MFNLSDILKLIINSFYKCAFPQANLVGNAHKRVFQFPALVFLLCVKNLQNSSAKQKISVTLSPEESCEIYVKKNAAGKYFPQTGIGGYTYELMTEEEELLQVKIIKGLQTDETVVTIKRED